MFDRLERALASIGLHLPANLTAAQRKMVMVFGGFACLMGLSVVFGAGVAILIAGATLVFLGGRSKSAQAKTPPAPTTAPTPGLRHRPAPALVVPYGTHLRPLNDLLAHVAWAERPATTVALLDILELFCGGAAMVGVSADEVNRRAAAGDLPRMTKAASDLFGPRPTILVERRVEGAEGLHLAARLLHPTKPNVRIDWTVLTSATGCTYRIDAVALG